MASDKFIVTVSGLSDGAKQRNVLDTLDQKMAQLLSSWTTKMPDGTTITGLEAFKIDLKYGEKSISAEIVPNVEAFNKRISITSADDAISLASQLGYSIPFFEKIALKTAVFLAGNQAQEHLNNFSRNIAKKLAEREAQTLTTSFGNAITQAVKKI